MEGSDLRFSFEYDSATGKLGYLDSNGDFCPFSSGGGIDTSDATAYAKNIQKGYTAYARGEKIVGTAIVVDAIQKYTGSVSTLGQPRSGIIPTSIGDYAFFVGGYAIIYGSGKALSNTDAYNSSLTLSSPSSLRNARYAMGIANTTSYAIFAGGSTTSYSMVVEAFNASLTNVYMSNHLEKSKMYLAGANVGEYALFAGGEDYYSGNSHYSATVEIYDNSLTKSNGTNLQESRADLSGTSIGNYAIFAGGYILSGGYVYSSCVDCYDNSLTRSNPTRLSSARSYIAATSTTNYAIFAGGGGGSGYEIDALNSSLTRSLSRLKYPVSGTHYATSLGDYAVIASGTNGYVNSIDNSLSSSAITSLSPASGSIYRYSFAAASNSKYAIFAGGEYYSGGRYFSNMVDAYYSLDNV